MNNLFPASVAPYVKAWVSLLGVIVAAVVTAWTDVPRWVTIVGAVLSSVGVYLASNGDKPVDPAPPAAVK